MRKALLLGLLLVACTEDPEQIMVSLKTEKATQTQIKYFIFFVQSKSDATKIEGYPVECLPSRNCIKAKCGYSPSDPNFELPLNLFEKGDDVTLFACGVDNAAGAIQAGSIPLKNVAPGTGPDIQMTNATECSSTFPIGPC